MGNVLQLQNITASSLISSRQISPMQFSACFHAAGRLRKRLLRNVISKLLAIFSYVNYRKEILASFWGIKWRLVAHTGFEPVISALRGQRPEPLDECALIHVLVSDMKLT